ncbi:MAG: NAD-dependent epimerase/dehydratase family protein [Burkholderiaceae bacterium]|nr:NAD-dependent epimerase/dehydratase family protein [Burkholderiaceae bacterium]
MPSRVFVTGADGFIGRHLCQRLERRGFAVTRAVRGPVVSAASGRCVATGDLAACEHLVELLARHDAVVHLAGRAHVLKETAPDPRAAFQHANVDATARLARAAVGAGVRRFVFVSTIGVFGNCAEQPLTETHAAAPVDPYAESKLLAERALAKIARPSPMETVVLRPVLVYGPHCPGNLARLARLVARGIPLPVAGFTAKRSLMGVENLCALIEKVVLHPAAAGEMFVAADGEDVSLPELMRYLADGLGVPVRLFPAPARLLALAASLTGQRAAFDKLTKPLRADVTKARALLGWSPEVSVADGLRATGRSFADTEAR